MIPASVGSMPIRSLIFARSITSDGEDSRCSSPGSAYDRPRGTLTLNPLRTWPRLRRPRRDDDRLSRTYCYSLSTVNGVPDAIGRRRHFKFVVANRISDRVDHGRRRADGAGLAATLDAERIARAQRGGVGELERRQGVGARHGIVHERRRHRLAVAVIDRGFQQRLADALRKPAMHLTLDDHWIDQAPEIVRRHEVDKAGLAGAGIDLKFADIGACRA